MMAIGGVKVEEHLFQVQASMNTSILTRLICCSEAMHENLMEERKKTQTLSLSYQALFLEKNGKVSADRCWLKNSIEKIEVLVRALKGCYILAGP